MLLTLSWPWWYPVDGHPELTQFGCPMAVQENAGGCDAAVQDAVGMQVAECGDQLDGHFALLRLVQVCLGTGAARAAGSAGTR